jgi:phosphomannomutase
MDQLKDKLSSKPPTMIGDFSVKRIIDLDGFKFILRDQSWIGIRLSGTEPVVRCYAESDSPKKLQALLSCGKKLITG